MNLSLRTAVILAILMGLCLPAIITGYIGLQYEEQAAQNQIARDQQRIADVLALGMQEPLWNLAPDSGRPLLDSLMSDQRIVSIKISDQNLGGFLSAKQPERQMGHTASLSRPVIKQGVNIGVASVEFSDGISRQYIKRKLQIYLLAVIIQVVLSLVLILLLLNSRILRPLKKLTEQSQQLADRQLNQAFIWRRHDELGHLGQSLESTRQALHDLIGTLEQKNVQLEADLISRQQIESALRVSQDRFRRLVESTRIIPWDARPDEWRFTYVGPQAETLLGYPISVWYSEAFLSNYLHPDDRHLAYPLFADKIAIGQTHEFECRLLAASGKAIWVHFFATVSQDQNGQAHLQGFLFDIQARKHNEQQLEHYHHHLEDVVESRSRALVTVNHELEILMTSIAQDLRSPLKTIDGFSQVLIDDYREKLDGNARNYLLRIRSSTQTMSNRIDDLLMLQELSRNELRPEEINLSAMAHDIMEELSLLQIEREITLNIQANMLAFADRHLMRIALYNFFENAWQFAKPEQAIHVEFACDTINGQPVFYIADQGLGLDPEQSKRLFTPFFRSQHELRSSGIGLTVVQRIISRHNGHLWVKSNLGEGATFYFTLPDSRSAQSA
ncbi:ATP-binding protein [Deefgea salmonis]|uniref:histidine kinase n=1 Tax=Deefgea salmonis TaxID=2875502 RepID=A0ABS8BGE7_9NEIS|nr:ATP-binding protein [Deefgea salmonis]MCB5194676.1 PAS domain-containing protein [Deefgea salmonis]